MHSVKTINNQNAITSAVLGLDANSNTIVNGNLTIQDASGSYHQEQFHQLIQH